MKTLREKLKKQGGFTMVEMLIVVAIIAILMAVSIPMFNNALEKARHGVDAANNRSAISLANAQAVASLNPEKEFGTGDGKVYFYIAEEEGDHQAALLPDNEAGSHSDDYVRPQCTTDEKNYALKVRIQYNPTEDDPLEVFKITTNWKFEDDGHVKSTDTPAK